MKLFQKNDIFHLNMTNSASIKITNLITASIKKIDEIDDYSSNRIPPWERDVRHGIVKPANLSLNEYHILKHALRIQTPESEPKYYLYDKQATHKLAVKEKWGDDIDKEIENDFYNIKEWTENEWNYYDLNLIIKDNKNNELISLNKHNIGQSDIMKTEDYLLPIMNNMLIEGIEKLPENIKIQINQYNTYQKKQNSLNY